MRTFLHLTWPECRLLIRSGIILGSMRVALWVLPFRTLREFLGREKLGLRPAATISPERIAWAIQVMSRYVPRPTCLVQALSAQVLLANAGFASALHIGVARGEQKRLEAHAWIESCGTVISGGRDFERYSPLLVWKR